MTLHAVLPAALGLHLASAALALGLGRSPGLCRWAAFLGAALASALAGGVAVGVLLSGRAVEGVLWPLAPSGLALSYRLGPLAAWFLAVFALLAAPVAVYSIGYLAHGATAGRSAFAGVTFNLLLAAVEAVFCAGDVVTFLLAWELMTLATTALVATEHEQAASRRAAFLYLVLSHVGAGCLLAGFLSLASAGGTLELRVLLAGGLAQGAWRDLLFALFFVGFGVKAGVMPLHVWLPEAHPAAPSSISALMSAGLVTTGIYGLVRVCALGLGTPAPGWGLVTLALGSLSAILGVLYALAESDLKRMLAFSTIENVGIVLVAVGAGMTGLSAGRPELAALGMAAALYHVLNHAAFKGLLFLGAGAVVTASGSRRLEDLGGLARRMPRTAALFVVGAAAISGLPLLNGFVSEWLVFQSLLAAFRAAARPTGVVFPLAAALLALTSALAATCFVKACGATFLALPRSAAAREAREVGGLMLLPQAGLALACLALGLAPGAVLAVLSRAWSQAAGAGQAPELARGLLAVAALPPAFDHLVPGLLLAGLAAGGGLALLLALSARVPVRRAPTWGCGGELTAHNEFSAAAFSKPALMVFRGIYRPTRDVARSESAPYFGQEVRYRSEIAAPFERYLYAPATRALLAVAERLRFIQAGSLHAYLAYVLVLGVALLWWLGG